VETLGAGLPPVACLVVTELERDELERAELLEELELAEPPPLELLREPPEPPAPADPDPERRAIICRAPLKI
jgi:hypothetical protein